MLSEEAIRVRSALEANGLETPMLDNGLTAAEKRERIQASMTDIITTLGLDLADDSLMDTPQRIAKMYVDEIFSGLDYSQFPKMSLIENKMGVHEPVQVSDISVTSTCEHHFVTIDGTAKIAYIPRDKVLGLSKINRLIHFFAQRPQVQERLTQQTAVALQALTGSPDVAVSICATHYCVKARGIRDTSSYTTTTAMFGEFKNDPHLKGAFLYQVS